MKVILSDDGLITFEDGGILNRNTLNRKRLTVVPETALAAGESLWVQFGDNIDYDSAESEILEPVKLEYIEADRTYITLLPDEVLQKPGVWYMTLAIRLYSADGTIYQSQLTSEKTSFTVNDSYPLTDGGYASNGTVQNLYNEAVAAKNAAQVAQEAAETAQEAAETAQSKAETAKEAAEAAQEAAETAEANAEAAEQGAQAAQAAAETAQGKAEDAQEAAETAQAAAETAAGEAASSASAAADSAAEAADSATAAAESANSAAGSALEAQGYMEQAKEYAKKEYALYDSVDDLPIPGDSAFIYIVPQTGGEENDNYAEYLSISETQRYEFIGTVNDIDISNVAYINGTYPDMTVGNATHATSADSATNANHAVSADRANDPNAVHFTEQTLTAEQQAQARTNIGAASEEALEEGLAGKQPTGDYALQNGSYPDMAVGNATNAGLAAQATKLATGRTIRTNLGSTAAPSFDGTANVTPGVTGTLPVANGGTGQTDLANVTVGNATNAETAEKVANALTVTVNGEDTEYDGSAAAAVTVSASNPNLLDNSNFAINQSGNTNPSNRRMVDRWVFEGASTLFYWYTRGAKPYKTGLQMQSQGSLVRAIQYFENDLKRDGTHYTLTVGYSTSNTSDATIYEVTHTYPVEESNNAQDFSFELVEELFVQLHVLEKTSENHDNLEIRRTASSSQFIIILYIKLEEGDVATPYEIPDPATELLKCQRYYVKFNGAKLLSGSFNGGGQSAYVLLPLPATMRTTPSIVSYDATEFRIDGNRGVDIQSLSVNNAENGLVNLQFTTSGTNAAYQATTLFLESIELSAELTS